MIVHTDLKQWAHDYWNWYEERQRKPNLIGFKIWEDFYENVVLDSLLPLEQVSECFELFTKTKNIIDIGTGGGFPLLPLSLKFPDHKFLGVDSIQKKIYALKDFVQLYPDIHRNVSFQCTRLENLIIEEDCILTFKAIGRIKDLLNLLLLSKIKKNTKITCIFYKGAEFQALEGEDLVEIQKKWQLLWNRPLQSLSSKGRCVLAFSLK